MCRSTSRPISLRRRLQASPASQFSGRERLDKFLREYFDHFAFQSMSSERMLDWMTQELLTPVEAGKVEARAWIYQPGVPANIPTVRSDAFAAVERQVESWMAGGTASNVNAKDWSTHEWLHFLRSLPDTIPAARMADLDKTFKLSSSGNSEIMFAWLKIVIANRYEPAFPSLERFLTSQGRRKFVAPLYTDLAKTEWGKKMALDVYRRARPTYHSVAVGTIDKALGLKPPQ